MGLDPFKVVRSGPEYEVKGDPLIELEKALAVYKYVNIPEIPTFTGSSFLSFPFFPLALKRNAHP